MNAFYCIITIGVVSLLMACGQSVKLEDVAEKRKPHIQRQLGKRKMIVLELTGDPNETSRRAWRRLFGAWFKLAKDRSDLGKPVPRALWPAPSDRPRQEWIGRYALQVPTDMERLPDSLNQGEANRITLETWAGGDFAEILHVGPYSAEKATVAKLHEFIAGKGYRPDNQRHEEVYLKGPGMFFQGDPDTYLTLIRYPVTHR